MKYTLGLKGLPFEPHPKQIIYVESDYDREVNDFIERRYDYICDYFASQGYEFVYLPLLYKKFDNNEIGKYYDPETSLILSRLFNEQIDSTFLLNYMARPQNRGNIPPSLIYYKAWVMPQADEDIALRGIMIGNIRLHNYDFSDILDEIIADQKEGEWNEPRFMYAPSKPEEKEKSDHSVSKGNTCYSIDPTPYLEEQFDIETSKLVKEIEERVSKLRQKGISLYVLENILRPPIELSRMVITSDYRILLPDYNDMEIEMTPLVKAIYILFLRHEEGIPFKFLSDYHDELLQIYTDVRGSSLTSEMRQSVIFATSPFNNSINEKCARIREAFVAKFDERLAEPYIVRGKRGEPKKISIPRKMIEWQMK